MLITHLCCLFSTILRSLSKEMLYCHLIVIVNSIPIVQRRIDRSSHWKFSIKKVFLQISQNSRENTCARVSSLRDSLRDSYDYRFLSVNFPKFVGSLFITKHLWGTAFTFRTMSNIYDRTFLSK